MVSPSSSSGFSDHRYHEVLSAIATHAQVSLSWSASSTYTARYDVKRAEDINGPYIIMGSTAALTCDDTDGLVNATTCYCVMSATNAGEPSSEISPVSATPFGPMPFVPDTDHGLGAAGLSGKASCSKTLAIDVEYGLSDHWLHSLDLI